MINAYQSALSGLKAFGTAVQATSHNVANANTNNFKRTRVTLDNVDPQGVKAQVSRLDTPGPTVYQDSGQGPKEVELSNVDLAEEMTQMMTNSHFYKANLKTIETVNEMSGAVLDIKS